MRELFLSLSLLLLLAGATLINVLYLDSFTADLSSLLQEAQNSAEEGNSDHALRLTRNAQEQFESHAFYLHVTQSHRGIDEIKTLFGEVAEHLRLGEVGTVYSAANSRLLTQLSLLAESEHLNVKNIF